MLSLNAMGQGIHEIWTDYNHSSYVGKKTIVFGDVGYRFTNIGDIFLIRPSIKYTFKNGSQIMGGLGYFIGLDDVDTDIFSYELRPWQGYKYAWPRSSLIALKHFVRLEESFQKDLSLDSFNKTSFRFRYQIGTTIDIWYSDDFSKELSIPIEYELFYSFKNDNNYVSRDRFIGGLSFVFGKVWSLEFNYIFQRDGVDYGGLNRRSNIYRFRFKRNIGFRY